MDIDLKKLEKRAFMTFFQDGLWDICLGLFIMGWGIGILTDMAFLIGGWFIVIYLAVLGIKKWLTYPRIGYVKLNKREVKMKLQLTILLGVVMLLGVFITGIFALDTRPQWLSDYFPMFFSGMLALIVIVISLWVGAYRFILYAVFILGAGAIHQWLDLEWSYTYIGAGSVIILIGLSILISFLRKYPKTPQGETDASP